MDNGMKVDVSAIAKDFLKVEVDADLFGKMFANMAGDEQAQVLKSIVKYMNNDKIQWDYIFFAMRDPDFDGVAKAIIDGIGPGDD